jgi:hypothetical protein
VESHGHEWRTALGGDGVKCGAGGAAEGVLEIGGGPEMLRSPYL